MSCYVGYWWGYILFEFRFFEIYRSSEYLDLILDGILISSGLTIASGFFAVINAIILAAVIYWKFSPFNFLAILLFLVKN